jgi:ATP phosphoribosyltransferase regulatory subunit
MNTKANRWQLPDGVDEVLPPRADQLETLRRDVLDLYRSWGYDLIKTPLIEFLDSLHIAPSPALQLSTFTLVDQLSGRTMGVRADITSQAARIDAHVLQQQGPTRLCYVDSVLRTRPNGQLGSRSPQLVGAELYGHSGVESDIEVISLMLHTLQVAGIEQPLLALGHNTICRELLKAAQLAPDDQAALFHALQNKATTDIARLLKQSRLSPELQQCLSVLPTLHGDPDILNTARAVFKDKSARLLATLDELQAVITALQQRFPQQQLYVDLCEQRGFDYHTGILFSAFVSGYGGAIANGGRYDGIGTEFGRSRAATGFDADMKTLLALSKRSFAASDKILAPATDSPALQRAIDDLRAQGRRVVQAFAGQAQDTGNLGCSQQLVMDGSSWKVVALA